MHCACTHSVTHQFLSVFTSVQPDYDWRCVVPPSCSKHTDAETLLPKELGCDLSEEIDDDNGEDFEELTPKIKSPWQMHIKLKNTALTSDHLGLLDRATVAIASSVLQDFGIATDDHTHVVDKNKLRREKSVHRSELQMQNKDKHNPLQGLYFDGRTNNTLMIEKDKRKAVSKNHKRETLINFTRIRFCVL
ncbi:hypothetical protein PR048_029222 [Dryococelus australis]|uniref:Uncharacterized protein n=1 Tax=Dryococelus australis TaxID=614101 RepID=A0ABQ9GFC5_9NEOP|nr:hypothetical protein PR048_029222 [Dryococelus australis]